jgi:Rv0078B-related antitoxin
VDLTEAQAMATRMRQAFDMFDAGVSIMRARLRREHPEADEQEISRLIAEWLHTRPGAEYGDAEGRPRWLEPRP